MSGGQPIFLPGVPEDKVREVYGRAAGNEIASGKFASPQSSAALAANGFGWFLDRPSDCPLFPPIADLSAPVRAVEIERELRLDDEALTDHVTAHADAEHTYDLFYHVRGTLAKCSVSLAPAEPFTQGVGYDMLQALRRGRVDGAARLDFTLRDGPGHLTLVCRSESPFEIYTGTCPDNPADQEMAFVMLRARSKSVTWENSLLWAGQPQTTQARQDR